MLVAIAACSALLAASASAAGQAGADWPQFRGPNRDLICDETGLLQAWPEEGPPLVWKASGFGQGYSSVSIAMGLIFTQGHFGGEEKLIAAEEATGKPLWSVALGPAAEVSLPGARGTPTVDGDRVYAQTVDGVVACVDIRTQQVVWHRQMRDEFKGQGGHFGYCESPLVDQCRVICTPGGTASTLVALDKHTGKTIWTAPVPDVGAASYSSAIVAQTGSVRQYVQVVHATVLGVRASDGALLWREASGANKMANCTTPVYHDGHVFSASAYEQGGALVRLKPSGDKCGAELVYHTKAMKNHHGGFLVWDGHIYGADESVLTCLNFLTGKVAWENRSVGKGAVLYADGRIYLRSKAGPIALLEATPEAYRETGRFEQPNRSEENAWAYPVIAGRKLYLRDQDILLCYDLAAGEE